MVVEGEGSVSALLPELLVFLIDAIDEQTEVQERVRGEISELTAAVRGIQQGTVTDRAGPLRGPGQLLGWSR